MVCVGLSKRGVKIWGARQNFGAAAPPGTPLAPPLVWGVKFRLVKLLKLHCVNHFRR